MAVQPRSEDSPSRGIRTDACAPRVRHRRPRPDAGSPALRPHVASGRRRVFAALVVDQEANHVDPPDVPATATRGLAASIPGASDPRPRRSGPSRGLHSLQSGEARPGRSRCRLAAFVVPPISRAGRRRARLGRCAANAARPIRRVIADAWAAELPTLCVDSPPRSTALCFGRTAAALMCKATDVT